MCVTTSSKDCNMTSTNVEEKLISIVRDVLDDYSTPITLATSSHDVPNWDSVNHINIIVGVEIAFKVKFRTAELEKLQNVGELVALIEKKTGAK